MKFYVLPCLRGFDCNDYAVDDVKFINCEPDAQPAFYDQVGFAAITYGMNLN